MSSHPQTETIEKTTFSEVTRIQEGGSISEVHPKNDVQGLKSEESEDHKLEASMGYESLSLKTKQTTKQKYPQWGTGSCL